MSSELKTNKISPATGTALTLADSGDTLTLPSGATLDIASGATIANSGTATGFGGDNTPSWYVRLSSDFTLAHGTLTKVPFDVEIWDTDSAYDSTTNYRFTVPVGAGGAYLLTGGIRVNSAGAGKVFYIDFYENGSGNNYGEMRFYSPGSSYAAVTTNTAITTLAEGDYVEMWVNQGNGSSYALQSSWAYFSGFKLNGVS